MLCSQGKLPCRTASEAAGLMAALMISIFLLPTLYVWFARDNDKLPKADAEFVEE